MLWYFWCKEDGEIFLSRTEKMCQLIQMYKDDFRVFNVTDAEENLYTLIRGLKY